MTKEEIVAELEEIISGEEEDLDKYLVIWDIQRFIEKIKKSK